MKFKHQDVEMEWNNVAYNPSRDKVWFRDIKDRDGICCHDVIRIHDVKITLSYFVSSSTIIEKLYGNEPLDDVPFDIFGYSCTIEKKNADAWHRDLTTGDYFRTKSIEEAEKMAIKWARKLGVLR